MRPLAFDDPTFDYQTRRAAAYATYRGAELGEVLATVDGAEDGEGVEDGDYVGWYVAWRATADRVAGEAESALAAGHEETARDALLRASNYYRTAEFFLGPDDPRRLPTYERSRETFRAALPLLDAAAREVEVPYEGRTLPGYLFEPASSSTSSTSSPSPSAEARPTVVAVGGFDAIAEELYFLCGVPAALERGYAVLAFDGPGQGAPLRYDGLTARPDWEAVVGPVLDFLGDEPTVDDDRTALLGASMGGYYAPRAAAFDDRVAACVAFDHCLGVWEAATFGKESVASLVEQVPGPVVNAVASLRARLDPGARWQLRNSEWVFGVDAAGLSATLKEYSLVDVADRIECPTLVLAGEDDHLMPLPLAYELVDRLGGEAELRVFTREEGAADHCQVGNLSLAHGVVYDWLDETLGRGS
ncbi:alpha/beta hydrolase family protein [Halobium salinum]|uniref:Alpha/beta hydrolase family protein n=1 Tax=Halobium salinum TaxID=1364940 RepID=A0ABD5PC10_9EURY|nr:alpha/beta fold hydrolase [Halobium salinum]